MAECQFEGGPGDGRVIEVEAGIMKVKLPGIEGDSFLSHEYARTGPDLFKFTGTKKGGSVAEISGRNLDYFFELIDRRDALEAKIESIRNETIEECAKKCRGLPTKYDTFGTATSSTEYTTKMRCAAAVYALKDEPQSFDSEA